jgi:enoyl-CoA hydratase
MSGAVALSMVGDSERVAIIKFDRPSSANAYTQPMLIELIRILGELAKDRHVRSVVFAGVGKHFCAGADRHELQQRRGEDALDLASRGAFDLLARMPQPVIAAIDGAAFGGGFELALACDYRISTAQARFALPETKLGLIPAAGGIRRLLQTVGLARTKEIVLFGRELDAVTALAWGVVNAIHTDVVATAVETAMSLHSHDAVALRVAKAAIDSLDCANDSLLESAIQAFLYERKLSR